MAEVIATDEFAEWYDILTKTDGAAVDNVIRKLEADGFTLGSPHASGIKGATFGLRELRCKSGSSPLRIFYAFDPARDAVLILGGNKSDDNRFYETMIPKCESIWREYLAEQSAGLHDKED